MYIFTYDQIYLCIYTQKCRFRNVLLAQRISALNRQNVKSINDKLDLEVLAQRFENVVSQNCQLKSIEKTENVDIKKLKIDLDFKEVVNKVEINDIVDTTIFNYDDNSNYNEIEKDIERKKRLEIDLDMYVNEINANFSKTNQTSELTKWKQKNENVPIIINDLLDDDSLVAVDSDVNIDVCNQIADVDVYIDENPMIKVNSVFIVNIILIKGVLNSDMIDSDIDPKLGDDYIDDINSVFMVNILPMSNPPVDADKEVIDHGGDKAQDDITRKSSGFIRGVYLCL